MDFRELSFNDFEEAMRSAVEGRMTDWVVMPVIVTEDSDGKTVKLKMTVKGKIKDQDGKVKEVDYPELHDVPIHFISGGGDDKDGENGDKATVLTHPIKKKDEGVILYSSRPIDNWFDKGGVQDAVDLRRHQLSDGLYIPGVRSKPRFLQNISTTSAQLRSVDAKHTVDHHPESGTKIKSVDKDDKEKDPFNQGKKYYESKVYAAAGVQHSAVNDQTTHKHLITHAAGHVIDANNGTHKATVHPSTGAAISADNGAHKVEALAGDRVKLSSTSKVHTASPLHEFDGSANLAGNVTAAGTVQGALGAFGGFGGIGGGAANSGGGASSGIGAGAMQNKAAATNILNTAGFENIPVAANNAAAATAGVVIGGLYRTNADPSQICVRTV